MFVFSLDGSKCERCFDCVTACPRGVFSEGESRARVVHPEECMGCWVCLVVCRQEGIKITEVADAPGLAPVPVLN